MKPIVKAALVVAVVAGIAAGAFGLWRAHRDRARAAELEAQLAELQRSGPGSRSSAATSGARGPGSAAADPSRMPASTGDPAHATTGPPPAPPRVTEESFLALWQPALAQRAQERCFVPIRRARGRDDGLDPTPQFDIEVAPGGEVAQITPHRVTVPEYYRCVGDLVRSMRFPAGPSPVRLRVQANLPWAFKAAEPERPGPDEKH